MNDSRVTQALTALAGALDATLAAVREGGLDDLDDAALLDAVQDFERVRNRMAAVDHPLVTALDERGLAGRHCQGRVARLLAQTLRLSAGEAGRRVRAAEKLGPRRSVLGEPMAAEQPQLAAAQEAGEVTPEQADRVLRGLASVDHRGFDPADLDRGEAVLTEQALTFGPRDLQVCVDRFVEHLDADGSRPDDDLNADRRFLELRAQRDHSWRGEFRLTGALGAKLQAVLRPLAVPRVGVATTADGQPGEQEDRRTYGQRLHDALEDVCDQMLRLGDQAGGDGVPATAIVTIDEESLRARTGTATTTDGTRLSVRQVLELADQAEIYPAVLSQAGAVLTLGRSRRIANRAQSLALIARDHGCSFPGCDRPPEWCERHHVVAWVDGGETDVDNLTLVCRYHHHNFASRGWDCRINADGLPEWIPPRHVDPCRRPWSTPGFVPRSSPTTRSGRPEPQVLLPLSVPRESPLRLPTRRLHPWTARDDPRGRGEAKCGGGPSYSTTRSCPGPGAAARHQPLAHARPRRAST